MFASVPAYAQWVNVPVPPPIDFGAPWRNLQAAQQTQAAQEQARAAQAQAMALQQQAYLQQQQLQVQRQQLEFQLQQQRQQLALQRQQLALGQAQQLSNAQQLLNTQQNVPGQPTNSIIRKMPDRDSAGRAALAAIPRSLSGDNAEDEYTYGYRLWEAGFFAEARQQLTRFIELYPDHSRISYGRNLLGRAYLDDGRAKEAAPWFLRNYQAGKQGARAADSLLYLAETMITVGDANRACIALDEFYETYEALAIGRLSEQYGRNRQQVRCKF